MCSAYMQDTEIQTVVIPLDARSWRVAQLPLSVRLGHVLERLGCRSLGDLHGKTYAQVRRMPTCGQKTISELQQLLSRLHAGELHYVAQKPNIEQVPTQLPSPCAIFIPQNARGWALEQLPINHRLAGVLKRLDWCLLGDLHGKSFVELETQKNCGRQTLSDLRRLIKQVQGGEFDRLINSTGELDPAYLVILLNEKIGNLPPRSREILLFRLGAYEQRPLTLEEVGERLALTRERIRQLVKKIVEQLRREGGPSLLLALRQIAERCQSAVLPLTPELWTHWLGTEATVCRFPLHFYLRLLRELTNDIPIWLAGKTARSNLQSREITRRLREVLRHNSEPVLLCEALERLRADKTFARLKALDFLDALPGDESLKVDCTIPDQPRVTIARLRKHEWAQLVLARAERPLTPPEMIASARRMFGESFEAASARTLENSLQESGGFYLLGPHALGIQQHFKLPEGSWPSVRNDIYYLLKGAKRPFSTMEVITRHNFAWTAQTTPYELVHVLRQDERFFDQGRFHFTLAEWGSEEREYINDLLPKVLAQAGHPIGVGEIIRRLRRYRSVNAPGMTAILRRHPEVREYGNGFYGMVIWDGKASEMLVEETAFVNRMISRAEPPFTFSDLCRTMEIPQQGKLADRLWQTVQTLPKVSRQPQQQTPEARLIHRNWGLERHVHAILEEAEEPLLIYEIQWELDAWLGGLKQTPAELERRLQQSRLFVRDIRGRYGLASRLAEQVTEMISVRHACRELLTESHEIVGCDVLLERLAGLGINVELLSISQLSAVLRGDEVFEEIGSNRFRVTR